MKDLWKIVLGIFIALMSVGLITLVSSPPRGQPIELTPPGTPAPLIIHVSGAVVNPGVYRLPPQSRIWDAVQAAGGFTNGADQEALNLAAFVDDGSKLVVPSIPVPNTAVMVSTITPSTLPDLKPTLIIMTGTLPASPYPRYHFPIDINTASSEELESLPQIGQVRAARIIAYRSSHGLFKRIEDIRNVYDITPEVYAAIRDLIIASPTFISPTSVSPTSISPTPAASPSPS